MEQPGPTPQRQPAEVSPAVELLLHIGVFTFASACFAVLTVVSAVRREWFGFALSLALASAYAARVALRIRRFRRVRRRMANFTDESLEDRHPG